MEKGNIILVSCIPIFPAKPQEETLGVSENWSLLGFRVWGLYRDSVGIELRFRV